MGGGLLLSKIILASLLLYVLLEGPNGKCKFVLREGCSRLSNTNCLGTLIRGVGISDVIASLVECLVLFCPSYGQRICVSNPNSTRGQASGFCDFLSSKEEQPIQTGCQRRDL